MKHLFVLCFILITLLSLYSAYAATKSKHSSSKIENVIITPPPSPTPTNQPLVIAASATPIPKVFSYFSQNEIIEEASSMKSSTSNTWWVSSGGQLHSQDGIAKTMWGNASDTNNWRRIYEFSNPTDTENGLHPQNIFRLVSKIRFKDYSQQVYFWVESSNLATSPQRNESNGIFLFNRYQDENNLYYTGLRVDGNLVIKKKIDGQYTTLAIKRIFPGEYNRDTNPNVIPYKVWIGIRSQLKNIGKNVQIKVYLDIKNSGQWQPGLEFTDISNVDEKLFLESGSVGLRTDFLDMQFKDFLIQEL